MKAKKTKENPITFFRKANEARQALVKKSIKKAQDGDAGRSNGEDPNNSLVNSKPIGANVSVGNFTGGYTGTLTGNKMSDSKFTAGYNNPKIGVDLNAGYSPNNKSFNAGVSYNTTIGKNKTPLKVGLTYNKKGGTVKSKTKK